MLSTPTFRRRSPTSWYPPPTPTIVSPGDPPDAGVWKPHSVQAVAAAKALAWERGLLVVPGRFFDDPERIRVSLGLPPSEMAAALDALGGVLDEFR
mgnify:CR=1 FL=1